MNKEEGSRYRYEKFPLCAYCAEFYGFYFNDPGQKRRENERKTCQKSKKIK
jgi:hypothetical protein